MAKIKANEVIRYEIEKERFYKVRGKTIGAIIDDEYCEYEENKYGDRLCDIYIGIDEIRTGKEHCKSILLQVVFLIINYILYNWSIKIGSSTRNQTIDYLFIMFLSLLTIIKMIGINNYKMYLSYTINKRLKN